MKTTLRTIVLIGIILLSACKGEEEYQLISAYPRLKLNLNGNDYKLKTPGEYIVFTSPRLAGENVGVSGLLVVCTYSANNDGSFALTAFDRFCPYEKSPTIKIADPVDGIVKCATCGSEFNVFYKWGTPISGPASKGLQRYGVYASTEEGVFYVGSLN